MSCVDSLRCRDDDDDDGVVVPLCHDLSCHTISVKNVQLCM